MTPIEFSVSEARAAITCPRIFYFDYQAAKEKGVGGRSVTRVWKSGSDLPACGTLFHQTIERFNKRANQSEEIAAALTNASPTRKRGRPGKSSPAVEPTKALATALRRFVNTQCLDGAALGRKDPKQSQAFVETLHRYLDEVAGLLMGALQQGRAPSDVLDDLFGDQRRRIDVTFNVGADGAPVRVRGALDYIFFDHRLGQHRILDYKLTPTEQVSSDLNQVSLYALMHAQQHQTQPSAGVLYLYPKRELFDRNWEEIYQARHAVYDLLASMREWSDYDESRSVGVKPPGNVDICKRCRWNKADQCQKRLGDKLEGQRLQIWADRLAQGKGEPVVTHIDNPAPIVESFSPEENDEELLAPVGPVENGDRSPAPKADSRTAQAEDVPQDNIWLGYETSNRRIVWQPTSVLPTHVTVIGGAGSGKTWFAKGIAEEAIRNGIPVLAVDPQGDLTQFLRPGPVPQGADPHWLKLRGQFWDRVEPRIWTPGTSHGIRLCLNPIALAREEDLRGEENPDLRRETWEAMLGVTASNLARQARGKSDLPQLTTYLLLVLRGLLARGAGARLQLSDVAAGVLAPESVGIDEPDLFLPKRRRENLGQLLNSALYGPQAKFYAHGVPLDLEQFCNSAQPGKTPLNVVCLTALSEEEKDSFLSSLIAEVHRWMIATGNPTSRARLLFYLDEARDFAPKGTKETLSKGPLIRLFSQGRKFGVACLVCTQSALSIDYNIFSNASTKWIGRLESAQDVERVREWFVKEGSSPSWLGDRKGAPQGTFVGRWPGATAGDAVAITTRMIYSLHEGAWSPERLAREYHDDPIRKLILARQNPADPEPPSDEPVS